MPRQKPPEMSDEMWAAVCIVMEDNQISSYKEMTESHQAMIARLDELETKWSEKVVEGGQQGVQEQDSGAAGQGGSGAAGQPGGVPAPQEGSGGVGGVTPPPRREDEPAGDEGDKRGSGRGGRLRWYEREGYAK